MFHKSESYQQPEINKSTWQVLLKMLTFIPLFKVWLIFPYSNFNPYLKLDFSVNLLGPPKNPKYWIFPIYKMLAILLFPPLIIFKYFFKLSYFLSVFRLCYLAFMKASLSSLGYTCQVHSAIDGVLEYGSTHLFHFSRSSLKQKAKWS